jgi:hypothetical protein
VDELGDHPVASRAVVRRDEPRKVFRAEDVVLEGSQEIDHGKPACGEVGKERRIGHRLPGETTAVIGGVRIQHDDRGRAVETHRAFELFEQAQRDAIGVARAIVHAVAAVDARISPQAPGQHSGEPDGCRRAQRPQAREHGVMVVRFYPGETGAVALEEPLHVLQAGQRVRHQHEVVAVEAEPRLGERVGGPPIVQGAVGVDRTTDVLRAEADDDDVGLEAAAVLPIPQQGLVGTVAPDAEVEDLEAPVARLEIRLPCLVVRHVVAVREGIAEGRYPDPPRRRGRRVVPGRSEALGVRMVQAVGTRAVRIDRPAQRRAQDEIGRRARHDPLEDRSLLA